MRSIILAVLLVACEGPAGPPGPPGDPGSDGSAGSNGSNGSNGSGNPSAWLTAPGIAIAVTGLTFDQNGVTIGFTITDGNGVGLDRTGLLTTDAVAVTFVMSQLATRADGSPGQYTAYTTHRTQPATESNGTFSVVDVTNGTYVYVLAALLTRLDPILTQTVGALAVRGKNATEAIARTTYSARPDHGAVIEREVVTAATCDSCHRELDAHGGRWTKPEQCILCHQPQNADSNGTTLDFAVMVHKIHRGSSLPSVVAGTPYQLVGYMQSINDFSTVGFPQNIARCTTCHAGAQGDRWETLPAKATCTSCHDTTSFVQPVPVGMVLHGGGAQPDNAACAVCHPATGGLAPIAGKHLTGLLAPNATTVALSIQSMTNAAPGQTPTLRFRALVDGAPRDLITSPLNSLTATIAGPTTDYTSEWQAKIQGSGAVGVLTAVDASQGIFSYTFPAAAAIPVAAAGSYAVGLEGYLQPRPADPRYAAVNPVLAFAVTDATPQPRRSIVSRSNCNGCHYDLAAHGGSRKNPDYCVFCHNPATYDSAGAPRFEATANVVADTIDFRHMIHKVHAGDQLSQPYVIGGFPLPSVANPAGTPHDFAAVRYPRALTDCEACHTSRNWTLPMTASLAYAPTTSALMGCSEPPGNDVNAYCDAPFWTVTQTTSMQPQASVCTSCHDAPFTAAHAQLNTTPAGVEACATCHGSGKAYDVGVLHGLP